MLINHSPETIDSPLNKYTINFGHRILAQKYDNGPINNISNMIRDAANAKLAIILYLHRYPKNLLLLEPNFHQNQNYLLNLRRLQQALW